ncbi:hypothetical protein U3516DRAFT_768812 [Neocallimastix sp. 'constans']
MSNSFHNNETLFFKYSFIKNEIMGIFRIPIYVNYCSTFVENDICHCCVEFPDKFESKYIKKRVIRAIMLKELIPQTEFGIILYIMVNSDAFPSSIILGQDTYKIKEINGVSKSNKILGDIINNDFNTLFSILVNEITKDLGNMYMNKKNERIKLSGNDPESVFIEIYNDYNNFEK